MCAYEEIIKIKVCQITWLTILNSKSIILVKMDEVNQYNQGAD